MLTRTLRAPAIRAALPATRNQEFYAGSSYYTDSARPTCADACHVNAMLGRSKAKTASRGIARPAAKAPTLSVTEIYRRRNVSASALPEERAAACAETCASADTCDPTTLCARALEEQGAANAGVLSTPQIYAAMNRRYYAANGYRVPR